MMHKRPILLFVAVLFLVSMMACRATGRYSQRLNNNQTTSGETNNSAEDTNNDEGGTAVPPSQPATSDDPLGDAFENLLNDLLHENDQADDLEDFPGIEN